jgi:hypothetical protein
LEYPLDEVALEPNAFFSRPKIPPLIGEIPEKAVPRLKETAHFGAPEVSPRLPSIANAIGLAIVNVIPPAIERARVAAESALPISSLYPTLGVMLPSERESQTSADPFPVPVVTGRDASADK